MINTLFDALLLFLLVTVVTLIIGLPLVMVGAHVARERHPQEYADWAAEQNPPTPPLFKPPGSGITGDAHARTRRTEEDDYYAEQPDNDTPYVDLYDTGVCDVAAEPEHDGRLGWTVRHG